MTEAPHDVVAQALAWRDADPDPSTRAEIDRLGRKVSQECRTLVPLRLYFKHGLVKTEIGVGRGKKLYDKRADKARRDVQRQMQRELGRRR